tara:strand:- start:3475 stop:3660 length:186 start_codon:yes stop_codon:yes gene_type:complete
MPTEKNKSLMELYKEGKITKANIKSIIFLAQTGMHFSTHPDDAEFISRQIQRLENGEDIDI